jgi:hypothetical protein
LHRQSAQWKLLEDVRKIDTHAESYLRKALSRNPKSSLGSKNGFIPGGKQNPFNTNMYVQHYLHPTGQAFFMMVALKMKMSMLAQASNTCWDSPSGRTRSKTANKAVNQFSLMRLHQEEF